MKILSKEQFENEVKTMTEGMNVKVKTYGSLIEIQGEFVRVDIIPSIPTFEEWEESGRKNLTKVDKVRASVVQMREISVYEMGELQIEVRDMQKLVIELNRKFFGTFIEA